MTQLDAARKKIITDKMRAVAKREGVNAEFICDGVSRGVIIIPANSGRDIKNLCAIGKGLKTKVNANIGSSLGCEDIKDEAEKLDAALKAGADTVMDLSTGEDLKSIRGLILERSTVPVGTVPIYEIVSDIIRSGMEISDITKDDIMACLKKQAEEGVDFFTVHCGVTREALRQLQEEKRLLDIVSRGGAFLAQWMMRTGQENPLYEYYDDVLEIAKAHDVTLSLGDGMRPGCIKDATDRAQITELITLGGLARRARDFGVQVMIEGPGHVPIDQIKVNIELEKSLCDGAPFYVLGPIVTDIAPGYDHITSAIGGAIAASAGADFLCYVTPSEHLRLPTIEDVREGVIASKIAAHAADIAKGVRGAKEADNAISLARKKRDWEKQIELSIDPDKARMFRDSSKVKPGDDVCTMCDKYCSIKIYDEALKSKR
ncbi:MAG: phosphomethylpyrimidine synthase ThiC [Candidatus Omnitrophica bacterium]|nr:phosphomethylpyrimidine synthase ThiC [Candidatus Omnitrophota bacterium]